MKTNFKTDISLEVEEVAEALVFLEERKMEELLDFLDILYNK